MHLCLLEEKRIVDEMFAFKSRSSFGVHIASMHRFSYVNNFERVDSISMTFTLLKRIDTFSVTQLKLHICKKYMKTIKIEWRT